MLLGITLRAHRRLMLLSSRAQAKHLADGDYKTKLCDPKPLVRSFAVFADQDDDAGRYLQR
jgi:hypothetical protein